VTDPYGSDPVFNAQSDLYDAQVELEKHRYYNDSEGSTELNEKGNPHPFKVRAVNGETTGYPIYFDAGISAERAEDLHSLMVEGLYLDKAVREMTVQLVAYNMHLDLLVHANIELSRDETGEWQVSDNLNPFSVSKFSVRDPKVFMFLPLMLITFHSLVSRMLRMVLKGDMPQRNLSFRYWVSTAHDALQLLAFACLMYIYAQAANLTVRDQYDIYESSYSPGNWLLPQKERDPDGNTTHLLSSGQMQRWQLPTNNTQMDDLGSVTSQMAMIARLTSLYYVLQCAVILTMVCKTLWMIDFQPRLAIFMNTCSSAASELGYLFSVTIIFFILYTMAAMLLFCDRMEEFTSFYTAVQICFSWMMDGNLDTIEDLAIPGYRSYPWEFLMEQFIRFTMPCIGKFFFMNVILGVVQAHFSDLQKDPETSSSLTPADEIWMQLQHRVFHLFRLWPGDARIFHLLQHQESPTFQNDSASGPFGMASLFADGSVSDSDSTEAEQNVASLPLLGTFFDKSQLALILKDLFEATQTHHSSSNGTPPDKKEKASTSTLRTNVWSASALTLRHKETRTSSEQLKVESARRLMREQRKKWPMWPMWPVLPAIAESVVDRLDEEMNNEYIETQDERDDETNNIAEHRRESLQKMTKWIQILGRQNELHLRQLASLQALFSQNEDILNRRVVAASRAQFEAKMRAKRAPAW